jgi:hypothetical protein
MHKIQPFPSWGSLRLPREIREQRQLNEQALKKCVREEGGGRCIASKGRGGGGTRKGKLEECEIKRKPGDPTGLKVDAG